MGVNKTLGKFKTFSSKNSRGYKTDNSVKKLMEKTEREFNKSSRENPTERKIMIKEEFLASNKLLNNLISSLHYAASIPDDIKNKAGELISYITDRLDESLKK
jgi:hypothetical protein